MAGTSGSLAGILGPISTNQLLIYFTRNSGPCYLQFSNEKRAPGRLGYIGDDELPSSVGIIIN